MKKILYVFLFTGIIFSACRKQPIDPAIHIQMPPAYLTTVQDWLLQNIATDAYANIDFTNFRLSKQKNHWYLRFALKNKPLYTDYLLLQTDSLGNLGAGKFIHLEKTTSPPGVYNGSISIISLDHKTNLQSAITNGYVQAWHPQLFLTTAKAESFPVPYDALPEVIVTAYIPSANQIGISYSDYVSLESMFAEGMDGNSAGSGVAAGGGTAYNSGYTIYSPVNAGTNSNGQNIDQDITVSVDDSAYRPAIDLAAWLKCFTDIPDAGASSSITLLGDLPEESDPSVNLNIFTGNTGHCFLQLQKTNGTQSVKQIIGFTAQSAGKAILNADAFVPGKTVDNAGHKYNCAITMYLTAAGFNTVIEKMKSLSDMPYSIVYYDCLDYGLEVFNSVRPDDPLVITKLFDPNASFSNIANGPKLYTLLQEMIDNGSPEAPYITLSGSRYAGVSHGACN